MKTIEEVIARIKEDKARAQIVSTCTSNEYMRQFFDGTVDECNQLLQFITGENCPKEK